MLVYSNCKLVTCNQNYFYVVTTFSEMSHFPGICPLVFWVFGVREPKNAQKLSKFVKVTQACYQVRLKCNAAPFFALERCIWVDFQAFQPKIRKMSIFLAKFQMD